MARNRTLDHFFVVFVLIPSSIFLKNHGSRRVKGFLSKIKLGTSLGLRRISGFWQNICTRYFWRQKSRGSCNLKTISRIKYENSRIENRPSSESNTQSALGLVVWYFLRVEVVPSSILGERLFTRKHTRSARGTKWDHFELKRASRASRRVIRTPPSNREPWGVEKRGRLLWGYLEFDKGF